MKTKAKDPLSAFRQRNVKQDKQPSKCNLFGFATFAASSGGLFG